MLEDNSEKRRTEEEVCKVEENEKIVKEEVSIINFYTNNTQQEKDKGLEIVYVNVKVTVVIVFNEDKLPKGKNGHVKVVQP